MTMPRFTAFAAAIAILFSIIVSSVGFANCTCPEPLVIDTIPEDGATDVPTNVRIALFGPACVDGTTATINGEELQRDGLFWKPSSDLEPETEYTIELDLLDPLGEELTPRSISFTTGEGPSTSIPPSPQVDLDSISSVPPEIDQDCLYLDSNTGCADAGTRYFFGFESEDSPLGWVIETDSDRAHSEYDRIWPSSCGAPRYSGYKFETGCFVIRAIDESGQLSMPTRWCFDETNSIEDFETKGSPAADENEAGTDSADSGCSSAKSADGWIALLLGLVLFRKKR